MSELLPRLAKSDAAQSLVNLCKAFPLLGTPFDAERRYQLIFDPDVAASMTPQQVFQFDIGSLAENQRREAEEMERQRREAEDKRRMPGLVRRLTVEQLLERQRREKAAG